jgi:hypothetical protein
MSVSTPQQRIINACEAEYQAHITDCSGFVKAVAKNLGIILYGLANDIVDRFCSLGNRYGWHSGEGKG